MKKLLFIGDVVGKNGTDFVCSQIPVLRKKHGTDIVVVNAENSAIGNGINKYSSSAILSAGADVLTTGNHCFKWHDSHSIFEQDNIIRPANYPSNCCGKGVCVLDLGFFSVAIVNLMGTLFMEAFDNPFYKIDELLSQIKTKNIFLDLHAEATSEKKLMGHYLTGRVTAVLGTHTHVQTSDELILGEHTAYITDVGMTGGELSVLGVNIDCALTKMKEHMGVRFTESDAKPFLNAVVIEFDEKSGAALSIERLIVR